MCRTSERVLAVPLERVVETMRPLPVDPFPGGPSFLLGLARIRDTVVPVLDLGTMLGASPARPGRFVTLRVPEATGAERTIALAVEAVVGVHELDGGAVSALPPVLGFLPEGSLTAIGTLDDRLLLVLGDAHLVPDSVWSAVEATALDEVRVS